MVDHSRSLSHEGAFGMIEAGDLAHSFHRRFVGSFETKPANDTTA